MVGDHVYLRPKPKVRSLKLRSYTKLAPWFSGPFQVLERIGTVAYKLALPVHLRIHNFFHVSLLNKYVYYSTHIIDWNVVHVELEGTFQVEPRAFWTGKKQFFEIESSLGLRCNGSTLFWRKKTGN